MWLTKSSEKRLRFLEEKNKKFKKHHSTKSDSIKVTAAHSHCVCVLFFIFVYKWLEESSTVVIFDRLQCRLFVTNACDVENRSEFRLISIFRCYFWRLQLLLASVTSLWKTFTQSVPAVLLWYNSRKRQEILEPRVRLLFSKWPHIYVYCILTYFWDLMDFFLSFFFSKQLHIIWAWNLEY